MAAAQAVGSLLKDLGIEEETEVAANIFSDPLRQLVAEAWIEGRPPSLSEIAERIVNKVLNKLQGKLLAKVKSGLKSKLDFWAENAGRGITSETRENVANRLRDAIRARGLKKTEEEVQEALDAVGRPMTYREAARITAGWSKELQAHHLVEQRHVKAFLEASGFTPAEIRAFRGRGIPVVLTNAEHERITATLRGTLIYGQRYGVEEVRASIMGAYREVGLSDVADSFLQSVEAAVRVRNAATGH